MTVETLKRIDEEHELAKIARKELDEAMEKYVLATHLHVEALRVHNESD